ncbi:MAG: hypothetical protein D6B26_00120, partial [Spirochaetaceae bacterium]
MKKQIKYTVILTALVILTSLLAAGCTNLLAEIQSAARAGFLADVQYRDMVDVDGGSYDQREYDSAYADSNGFQHTLSAYQIGAYEVTYELWY